MRKHVEYVLHICSQRLYLLTQLKKQGLPPAQLQSVFEAILLSRVLYAAPAWRGYLKASEIDSLQQMFDRARRWRILSKYIDAHEIFDKCEATLFKASIKEKHCMYHLYPEKQHTHSVELRPRAHNFLLPKCKLQLATNSFINRSLFVHMYV